ncbi:MAG TPA: addiction module protein [Thermoanaerobaculia bacterium]|nr:addiction module protein [Thermoanaerobaculia bacterium]
MRPTVEEVTKLAMELDDQERLRVAEELVVSVQPDEKWWLAWTAEADRRYQRLLSGEDPGLSLEEFWSDED